MKSILTIALASILTATAYAQDPCDELVIESVVLSEDSSQVVTTVTNNSHDIFSYPSFVLLIQGDTIALEDVMYFGIGGNQSHYLNVHFLPTLPTQADLHLETGFSDSTRCFFDVSIDMPITNTWEEFETSEMDVYPNPTTDFISINHPQDLSGSIEVLNEAGSKVTSVDLDNGGTTMIQFKQKLKPGSFYVNIKDSQGNIMSTERVLVQ